MADGFEFDWDRENTKHLAVHKVKPAEFEEVMGNDPVDLDSDVFDGEERFRSIGLTNKGRLLLVVYTFRQGEPAPDHGIPGRCFGHKSIPGEIAMKKQPTRIVVPKFATEAEEADWWYQNREHHGKIMLAAVRSGKTQILTREKLLARIEASRKKPAPVVALRIPEADLTLARKQAEAKGLPYQTYIKSLLHEALVKGEKRKAG